MRCFSKGRTLSLSCTHWLEVLSICFASFGVFCLYYELNIKQKEIDQFFNESVIQGALGNNVRNTRFGIRRYFVEGIYDRPILDTLEQDYAHWADWIVSYSKFEDSCILNKVLIDERILDSLPVISSSIGDEVQLIQRNHIQKVHEYNRCRMQLNLKMDELDNLRNNKPIINVINMIVWFLAIIFQLISSFGTYFRNLSNKQE